MATAANKNYPNGAVIVGTCVDKTLSLNKDLLSLHKTLKSLVKSDQISIRPSGRIIIVQTTNDDQTQRLLKVREVHGKAVSFTPHRTLNYVEGSVYLPDDVGPDELAELEPDLREQGVASHFLYENADGLRKAVFRFETHSLPDHIYLDQAYLKVRPYYPKPTRCTKCQLFGHRKSDCRSKSDVCPYCSAGHSYQFCTARRPVCRNCGDYHPCSSDTCPVWLSEVEVIKISRDTKVTITEARQIQKGKKLPPSLPLPAKPRPLPSSQNDGRAYTAVAGDPSAHSRSQPPAVRTPALSADYPPLPASRAVHHAPGRSPTPSPTPSSSRSSPERTPTPSPPAATSHSMSPTPSPSTAEGHPEASNRLGTGDQPQDGTSVGERPLEAETAGHVRPPSGAQRGPAGAPAGNRAQPGSIRPLMDTPAPAPTPTPSPQPSTAESRPGTSTQLEAGGQPRSGSQGERAPTQTERHGPSRTRGRRRRSEAQQPAYRAQSGPIRPLMDPYPYPQPPPGFHPPPPPPGMFPPPPPPPPRPIPPPPGPPPGLEWPNDLPFLLLRLPPPPFSLWPYGPPDPYFGYSWVYPNPPRHPSQPGAEEEPRTDERSAAEDAPPGAGAGSASADSAPAPGGADSAGGPGVRDAVSETAPVPNLPHPISLEACEAGSQTDPSLEKPGTRDAGCQTDLEPPVITLQPATPAKAETWTQTSVASPISSHSNGSVIIPATDSEDLPSSEATESPRSEVEPRSPTSSASDNSERTSAATVEGSEKSPDASLHSHPSPVAEQDPSDTQPEESDSDTTQEADQSECTSATTDEDSEKSLLSFLAPPSPTDPSTPKEADSSEAPPDEWHSSKSSPSTAPKARRNPRMPTSDSPAITRRYLRAVELANNPRTPNARPYGDRASLLK